MLNIEYNINTYKETTTFKNRVVIVRKKSLLLSSLVRSIKLFINSPRAGSEPTKTGKAN